MEIRHIPSALCLRVWSVYCDSGASDGLTYFDPLKTCGVDRYHDLKDENLGLHLACELVSRRHR